ncbi:winged helix-turn-helix domain-containing tetratricopeptide repeat protein [Epibacterium sp. Ofav1-8]|uniref:winged helix-turn-helix domain-containing tetratricopeptide repeat protein n=1 Tax=Epibacterium sp. Ofav1-8 TaxID=2917735 RepID=UPI001EF4C357|nr:winged helix-turn-helix domain-containing protein [Epibacterium sp. Ofav1-8]MCG7625186.1 winged helix-turn-helix domain-containing protein [Epibacterium sp. Ofav1-8]
MIIKFNNCVFDPNLARIQRDDVSHPLTPQTMRILKALIGNRHRVLTKDELVRLVWGDRIVSDASLSTAIKEARLAVGDSGREQHTIKTLHGHGFRFVADVLPDDGAEDLLQTPAAMVEAHRNNRPTIAVFPFQMLGSDAADAFVADGLTEQIIVNLSHFRELFVFSRRTTTQMAESGLQPDALLREFGVGYIVEGSIRKSSPRIRATVQVSVTDTGEILLTDQFDRDDNVADLIDIQDEIAGLIVGRVASRYGAIADHIDRNNTRRGELGTWEICELVARFHEFYCTYSPELHAMLRDAFPKALERDPGASLGWACYATVLLEEHRFHLNKRLGVDALSEAYTAARNAVRADPEDAFAQTALATIRFYKGDEAGFRDAAERALSLNDGHADVLAELGHCFAFLGEESRAIALLDRAIALSPNHPGWYHFAHCWRMARAHDFESALIEISRFPTPGFFWFHAHLAWFYVELGDMEQARLEITIMRDIYPDFETQAYSELDLPCYAELRDRAIAAWRQAGLEIRQPREVANAAQPEQP